MKYQQQSRALFADSRETHIRDRGNNDSDITIGQRCTVQRSLLELQQDSGR